MAAVNVKYEGLGLWNAVEKSDQRFLKKVEFGKRSFTTIDAYYQLKKATEIFGPYGKTWGLKNTHLEIVNVNDTPMAIYKGVFYYPAGEFEIWNAIKINDDEFAKKVETDTITKALSRLGFNADVFLGTYDNNRYKSEPKQENVENKPENTNKPEGVNDLDVLKKSGVELKESNGKLIAMGKTYQNAGLLKRMGFKWNGQEKVWEKKIA